MMFMWSVCMVYPSGGCGCAWTQWTRTYWTTNSLVRSLVSGWCLLRLRQDRYTPREGWYRLFITRTRFFTPVLDMINVPLPHWTIWLLNHIRQWPSQFHNDTWHPSRASPEVSYYYWKLLSWLCMSWCLLCCSWCSSTLERQSGCNKSRQGVQVSSH